MINSLHGNEAAIEVQHCSSTERGGSEKAISLTCSLARNTKSHIIIDFGNAPKDILDLFLYESSDLDLFFAKLGAYYSTTLYKRESLIVFDELQQFPRARQLVKYLVADGRYDYMETGSLIRLKKNTQNIIIPSEEEHMELFPLDFEEFLWAMGDEATVPLIRKCFDARNLLGRRSIERS